MSRSARAPARPGLRVGARWLVVGALIGAVAGLLWGVSDRPSYTAVATVIVVDRGEQAEAAGGGAVGDGSPRATERLLELARSEEVATTAAAQLGDDVPGADLIARTTFSTSDGGEALVVRSTATFADFAAAAADAFAAAVIDVAGEREARRLRAAERRLQARLDAADPASPEAVQLQRQLAAVAALGALGNPLEPGREAELPTAPEEDRPVAGSTLLGAGIGAALGALAGLMGMRVSRVRRPGGAVEAPGVAELGVLTDIEGGVRATAPAVVEVDGPSRAELSELVDAADLERAEQMPRAVALTSLSDTVGWSRVAVGLAAVVAAQGSRVLVLEADLQRPRLASLLGIENEVGLAEHLAGEAGPREVMRTIHVAGVRGAAPEAAFVCVPAGATPVGRPGLVDSRFGELVERLGRVYDLVLVLAPPLSDAPVARVAASVGEALVCLEGGDAVAPDLGRAAELLEGAQLLGAVQLAPAAE